MTEQENNDRTKLLLKDESRSRYVLWAAGGVLAALVAGAWYWYQGTQNTNAVKYVTEAVERGDVHVSVSADGTLAPVHRLARFRAFGHRARGKRRRQRRDQGGPEPHRA